MSHCTPLQVATPILEHASVFERTLGEDSDIIGKELYTFQDKSGDQLTMRPEGTAGAARALLSNNLTSSLPVKWYYHGPMFRHERPQKGRFRQVSMPMRLGFITQHVNERHYFCSCIVRANWCRVLWQQERLLRCRDNRHGRHILKKIESL